MILVYLASYQDVTRKVEQLGHALISFEKKKAKFSKPVSSIELSLGISRTSTAGKPEAPATETNPFFVLREKAPLPPSNPLEAKGKPIRGRKPGDPTDPVETTRASPLSRDQGATKSSPNSEKEEGEVTCRHADIPDSIFRALLDAVHEKRTGNQFPATMISIARVRAYQLQQCLVTGRETPEGTI